MNKHEFFKQFYPDYQIHEAKMKALQSAWDKLSIFNSQQPLSVPSIRIGRFEIMQEDWGGKAPKGNSVEIGGHWYYDYEAAISLELPEGYRLPTKDEWEEICDILGNDPECLQKELKLGLNGCVGWSWSGWFGVLPG